MPPRIYIADLAAYNNGILHGIWLEASQNLNELWSATQAMLKSSPISNAEEYAIHDYEGFEGYEIGEYIGLESAHAVACFIEEHGHLGSALLNYWCGDLQQAGCALEEDYYGMYESLADFAQELTEMSIEIPKTLEYYIDYAAMGRDLEINDMYTFDLAYDEIHVFWRR